MSAHPDHPDRGPNGSYWQGVVDTRLSNLERDSKQVKAILIALVGGVLTLLLHTFMTIIINAT